MTDKSWQFFEMQRHDAMRALDIYRRAGHQVMLTISAALTVIQMERVESHWNFILTNLSLL